LTSFNLNNYIKDHFDFPEKGIVFKDWLPLLQKPEAFNEVINQISNWDQFNNADAIIAIDARGFILGSCIAYRLSKPLILARKPGKLPGELITKSYQLEYGKNELSIQKDSLAEFDNFLIIDDLLATGGTVNSVVNILEEAKKNIVGLFILIELLKLKGRENFNFPIKSIVSF